MLRRMGYKWPSEEPKALTPRCLKDLALQNDRLLQSFYHKGLDSGVWVHFDSQIPRGRSVA